MILIASLAFAAPPTLLDVLEVRHVVPESIHPSGRWVDLYEGGWRFDPNAQPFGDTSAGWSYVSGLHRLDLQTGDLQPLAQDGWSQIQHPDGPFAYVGRDGTGGAQIVVEHEGRTTVLDTGGTWPSRLRWDVSGTAIWFLARSPRTEAERVADWWAAGVREFDDPVRTQRLHRVALDGSAAVALSPEGVHVEDYALHPSGGPAALITAATGRDYDAYFMARVQVLGSDGELTPLSDPGCAESLTYAPDGASLAWLGCDGGILVDQVWVHTDDATTDVVADADLAVTGLDWTDRGLYIWTQEGTVSGLQLLRKGRRSEVPLPPVSIGRSRVHPSGRWAVAVLQSPSHPGRVARVDLRSGKLDVLHDPNPHWSTLDVATTEVVQWNAPDGTALEGLLHRPPAGVPLKGLLVHPHGGPNSVSALSFSDGFHQAFAAAGYAVFQPNFRGGIGYGRAFYEANRGHIADVAFSDIEAGVDQLVAAEFDAEALYYGGWSYGGYLAAWTLGHTSRYRAIASGGTISSRLVQYTMSSNTGRRADFIFGGSPWTHRDAFDRQDPNRFLQDATTPTLLFHGADDEATPLPHALILYRALKDLGVETALYVYPDERHGNFEPARTRHVLEQWIQWMDEHGPSPR